MRASIHFDFKKSLERSLEKNLGKSLVELLDDPTKEFEYVLVKSLHTFLGISLRRVSVKNPDKNPALIPAKVLQ